MNLHSATSVGYQTKTSRSGFNFVAPTFENVSGGDLDVQSIKLSGDISEWSDSMQVLDEGGAVSKQYLWLEAGTMGDDAGWYDDDFNFVEAPVTAGQSVLISTENEGVNILFAGSVGQEDIVLSSIAGFNFVGNGTPVDVDIQKITLTGAQISEWSDSVQFLDDGGAVEKQYLWLEAGTMGDDAGWYDDDFNYVEETVDAGNGFLISTENAGVKILIPAAL